jgi:hypothetical protein
LELNEFNDTSEFDLFRALTLERVEQEDEQVEEDELEEEGVSDIVDEVESLEGDSHGFFLTRGNVPGGPIMGGASRCRSPGVIMASGMKGRSIKPMLDVVMLSIITHNVILNVAILNLTILSGNYVESHYAYCH